ncbi:hypothetical protein LSH36_58g15040, partial [Paralvinella palmiformis]
TATRSAPSRLTSPTVPGHPPPTAAAAAASPSESTSRSDHAAPSDGPSASSRSGRASCRRPTSATGVMSPASTGLQWRGPWRRGFPSARNYQLPNSSFDGDYDDDVDVDDDADVKPDDDAGDVDDPEKNKKDQTKPPQSVDDRSGMAKVHTPPVVRSELVIGAGSSLPMLVPSYKISSALWLVGRWSADQVVVSASEGDLMLRVTSR